MKLKKIPKEYFVTILDRLTRFEPAKSRIERVVNDLISKFYIDENKPAEISEKIILTEKIINNSLTDKNSDFLLNQTMLEIEKKYFKFDEISYQYLSNRFNFEALINEIQINEKTPKNVVWLKNILNNFKSLDDLILLREKYSLLYPIEKIILCEGQTESLLLKSIFNLYGYNLDKQGVLVVAAGGKNQVAKKYYEMIEYLNLPIFILLDSDASETQALIEPKLRKTDKIYLIQSGEFEDLIPVNILKNTLNYVHNCEYNCIYDDFFQEKSMVKNLELIYKKYGFGEFKKAQFAQELKEYIKANSCQDDFENSEIKQILSALQQ